MTVSPLQQQSSHPFDPSYSHPDRCVVCHEPRSAHDWLWLFELLARGLYEKDAA